MLTDRIVLSPDETDHHTVNFVSSFQILCQGTCVWDAKIRRKYLECCVW